MSGSGEGRVRFWRASDLHDLELIHASYTRCAFPRHIHDEYVIGLMTGGAEELMHRGQVHTAAQGSLILINPGEPHRNVSVGSAGAAYRTFYAPVELIARVASQAADKDVGQPLFTRPVIRDRRLFERLLRLHVALERPGSKLEHESGLLCALQPLLTAHAGGRGPSRVRRAPQRVVRVAREHLDVHYAQNTSLEELARVSGRSPFHFLRIFRDEIGVPPAEYQTYVRVRHARRRLREGVSIAETAADTGFVDQSHLTRCFKRVVGVTPGAYAACGKTIQDRVV